MGTLGLLDITEAFRMFYISHLSRRTFEMFLECSSSSSTLYRGILCSVRRGGGEGGIGSIDW